MTGFQLPLLDSIKHQRLQTKEEPLETPESDVSTAPFLLFVGLFSTLSLFIKHSRAFRFNLLSDVKAFNVKHLNRKCSLLE